MTRTRLLAIGAVIAAVVAALLVPGGAGAASVSSGGQTTTAPDSVTVKCTSGDPTGKLQSSFTLAATSFAASTKEITISGPGVPSGTTLTSASPSYTVQANTDFTCSGPISYTFTGRKNNGDVTATTTHSNISVSTVACPSGETC